MLQNVWISSNLGKTRFLELAKDGTIWVQKSIVFMKVNMKTLRLSLVNMEKTMKVVTKPWNICVCSHWTLEWAFWNFWGFLTIFTLFELFKCTFFCLIVYMGRWPMVPPHTGNALFCLLRPPPLGLSAGPPSWLQASQLAAGPSQLALRPSLLLLRPSQLAPRLKGFLPCSEALPTRSKLLPAAP